ncbi:KAR9 family protein [Aspergillus clavatus NRRL 1]|uniref:KAR9-domain-containing protein n=1 Tax=Aspergillus clavatus (strain ATCC 1007 / CBS 513.65 / DSM 816 / NCTC 3887 / NRRL 1 / QM 1276 / 107) TaxID=344612 RepID=A1CEG6_ASPCL|nr:uncharacterized protein ACLA_089570 [Aspergillus clavatus NRRL 1]EAW11265.1 hypothetical protein ACLA_089570 [Aspergillus clavatus NRRL 1]
MRAIFTGSTTSTATSQFPDPGTSNDLGNHSSTSPAYSPPTAPSVSVCSPDDEPLPRRIKSKSSLRSVRSAGSSHHEDEGYDSQDQQQTSFDKSLVRASILRRLSPGLAARVKLLDGSSRTLTPSRSPGNVGRIPEEHIKELDSLHQNLSIKIEKRGRSWNAVHLTSQQEDARHSPSDALEDLPHSTTDQPTTPVESEPAEPVIEDIEPPTLIPSEHTPATSHTTVVEASLEEDASDKVAVPEEPPVSMSDVEQSEMPRGIESGTTDHYPDQTDFEKYIQSTSDNKAQQPPPPPPPPKDSPPPSSASSHDQSYFNPRGLQRTESIYSFSRASFSNQLSQLTSITLPQPATLAASITGIPNAPAAVKALMGAAEQIQIWIRKASDVLSGLDAEDDVEWAAAGGREGLEGVDKAITRFESLVHVYVNAIEKVQLRQDIGNVSPDSLKTIVVQMDSILQSWAQIKARLKGVKEQVELAMEWEELWSNVLGDVGMEAENLSRLVFEMEEKRHFTMSSEHETCSNGLDINELETIVEETPSNGGLSSKRFSMGPILSVAPPLGMPIIQTPQDDSNHSNLMALFARMQPLRASLDFLPMRLSMFQSRAERIFPSACQELEDRRSQLENSYKVLETDAEALRKELSEDKWILVFRNAGGQAHKMFESVERSIAKMQEALETGAHLHNPAGLSKRIESYEAKKMHYVPAIERVVSIIEKGVKDRLTVNGEILRLLSDMSSRVDALKASLKVMDSSLDDLNLAKTHQLRDSISSIITMDSPLTSSVVDTPGSSPASSVVMTPGNALKGSSTPLGTSSRRGSSVGSTAARTAMSKVRRYSGLPQAASTLTTGLKSAIPKPSSFSGSSPSKKDVAMTPTPATRKVSRLPPPPSPLNNRPRWTTNTNTNDLDVGHTYKSHTPLRKSSAPARTSRTSSTMPVPNSSRRDQSVSPAPCNTRSMSRVSSRLAPRSPGRTASPSPSGLILDPPPYSKFQRPGAPPIANTPRNRQSYAGSSFSRSVSHGQDSGLLSPTKAPRPGTSLGHSSNRRISLLPLPKPLSGRDSAAGSRSKLAERPPWR